MSYCPARYGACIQHDQFSTPSDSDPVDVLAKRIAGDNLVLRRDGDGLSAREMGGAETISGDYNRTYDPEDGAGMTPLEGRSHEAYQRQKDRGEDERAEELRQADPGWDSGSGRPVGSLDTDRAWR